MATLYREHVLYRDSARTYRGIIPTVTVTPDVITALVSQDAPTTVAAYPQSVIVATVALNAVSLGLDYLVTPAPVADTVSFPAASPVGGGPILHAWVIMAPS